MAQDVLRLGRWQDVLAGVEPDVLITDAPYSATTHRGHDAGRRNDGAGVVVDGEEATTPIGYEPFTEQDVAEFVQHWSPRTRGWFVTITDHVLAPIWMRYLEETGRYIFAPLPMVETGSRVRLTGDGPSSWTCWVIVARPRTEPFSTWGTLPGAYVGRREKKTVMGGKPMGLMRALVRDYSRPGDLVVDPCAGGATTLLAALTEGRRAMGSEALPDQHAKALAALRRGYTPSMDFGASWEKTTDDGTTCGGSTSGCSGGAQ